MPKLTEAAQLALTAIDEGWLFERIDNEVAPALREALKQPWVELETFEIARIWNDVSTGDNPEINIINAIQKADRLLREKNT